MSNYLLRGAVFGVACWLLSLTASVHAGTPVAPLVVNEIDYDAAGTDFAEFVELRNNSGAPLSLSAYRVELVNGGNNTVYQTLALPAVQLAANDYFVICVNAATTPNCDLDGPGNQDLVQNGSPDGVRIVRIADTVTIDGMAYEGSMPCCTEGTALPTAGDDNTTPNFGYARAPGGTDTNDNLADFTLRCTTPGATNSTANTACPAPLADPVLSIAGPAPAPEGTTPACTTRTATFTVTASSAPAANLVFNFNTVDGTAQDGNPPTEDNDYVPRIAATGTIAGGSTTGTVTVDVVCDSAVEADETFSVALQAGVGYTVSGANGSAAATLENDDFGNLPQITIADATKQEGDATNASSMRFVITSSQPAPAPGITFDVATQADTGPNPATAGSDYTTTSTVGATMPTGATQLTFDVPIADDVTAEPIETFRAVVTNVSANAVRVDGTGIGSITDNEWSLVLTAAPTCAEGDANSVFCDTTVTLSSPLPTDLAFNIENNAGSAPPSDVVRFNQNLTITAGNTTRVVPVEVVGDIIPDAGFTNIISITTSDPRILPPGSPFDWQATITITDDDTAAIEIFTIQGNGARSSFAPPTGTANGAIVTTLDNIVTAVGSDGFAIQTPTARADADPLTSNAVWVFSPSPPTVLVGDRVNVKGRAQEFFNMTEIAAVTAVFRTSSGNALPAAVIWNQNVPSRDNAALTCGQAVGNFECFESMLVTVPVGIVTSGNLRFASDLYAEVYASAVGTRARREEGVRFGLTPARPEIPVFDGNPEVFEIDADKLIPANANLQIVGGAGFSATGVVGYDFGGYELWPTQLTLSENTLPRPVPPSAGPSQLSIGSYNMFRYCATAACADGAVPTPGEIAAKAARLSDYVRTVLRSPDVVGVQEVDTLAILQQLATKIATDGGPTYQAYLEEGNDIGGIDNGFLVRTDRVTVIRVRQLGKDETITDCSGTPPCAKHDRPPLLLQAVFTGNGASLEFAVMDNHTRSRSGLDTGTAAETARVRAKRFAQGTSIATFVQRFQTGVELDPANPNGDIDTQNVPLVLVGDYNAFEVTDGWVDVIGLVAGTYDNTKNELQLSGGQVTNPPLLIADNTVPLEKRYSYHFAENYGNIQGQEPRLAGAAQILDHALVNVSAQPYFKAMHYGNSNADAPINLQLVGTGGLGSSDHDGLVIYLETGDSVFANGFE